MCNGQQCCGAVCAATSLGGCAACCLQVKLTQDVSLPGMMTAITEVEVSKEAKMRKIEETERVKAGLLAKKTGYVATQQHQ